MKTNIAILGLACLAANPGDNGGRHPENQLLARPEVRITVGVREAHIKD